MGQPMAAPMEAPMGGMMPDQGSRLNWVALWGFNRYVLQFLDDR